MPACTYTPAPVDGALSVLQIFEFQAKTNPQHPLFRYDCPSARDGYEEVAWPEAVRMFETTARVLRRRLGSGVDYTTRPVVGILAATSAYEADTRASGKTLLATNHHVLRIGVSKFFEAWASERVVVLSSLDTPSTTIKCIERVLLLQIDPPEVRERRKRH
ncbi:hypothetical protein MSAN_01561800 [Mycena sanguinolenta]|uniref:Uncharacterized protein n=1 Tax=Mycena sanguinolenta TaxID=230812 RepID=A0A8H6XZP0_9AGAR|nr:hypothetical protein MSAN_01561800 [Mycena sanguinolenta]